MDRTFEERRIVHWHPWVEDAATTKHITMTWIQTKLSYELGCRLGYQGPRKNYQPGSCEKSARVNQLNILQINISGFTTKSVELMKLLNDENIHVALIEETILPNDLKNPGVKDKSHRLSTTGYTPYPCKCSKCQGILTLIRNDIQAEVDYKPAGDVDHQVINVWKGNTKYLINHVYCPPASTSELPFLDTKYRRCIIAGDFNAHMPLLGYEDWNSRGHEIERLCLSSNLILQQSTDSEPTLLHKRHNTTSRPDLTFISADIQDRVTTRVLDGIGSDHKPTKITISNCDTAESKRKTYWNFRKAKWKEFTTNLDSAMSQIDTNASQLDEVSNAIESAFQKAASKSIPRGSVKKFKPFWNKELEETVKERKKLGRQLKRTLLRPTRPSIIDLQLKSDISSDLEREIDGMTPVQS